MGQIMAEYSTLAAVDLGTNSFSSGITYFAGEPSLKLSLRVGC
jgi:hypothetical protein